MVDTELAWRIEEACLKAWPALREEYIGGWALRFADNLTRRANSINPVGARVETGADIIAQCEARYRASGQPVIFRLPSLLAPAMQDHLADKGYTREGDSLVMQAGISDVFMASEKRVSIAPHPSVEWLSAMSDLQGHAEPNRVTYAKIATAVSVPAAFAMLSINDRPISVAYGVVHNRLFVFESVITDPLHRRQGHGKRMLGSLIAWAKANGAEGICLQVQGDNINAQKVYHDLGLRVLYGYHYRRGPASN